MTHQCKRCLRYFSSQAELNSHGTALVKPCVRYDMDAIRYWAKR